MGKFLYKCTEIQMSGVTLTQISVFCMHKNLAVWKIMVEVCSAYAGSLQDSVSTRLTYRMSWTTTEGTWVVWKESMHSLRTTYFCTQICRLLAYSTVYASPHKLNVHYTAGTGSITRWVLIHMSAGGEFFPPFLSLLLWSTLKSHGKEEGKTEKHISIYCTVYNLCFFFHSSSHCAHNLLCPVP